MSFHYLFDGCPLGGLVSRRYGVSLKSKVECERDCTIDPNCTAIEMTGCSTAHKCHGQCSLFSGAGRNIHNGECILSEGQKVYLKPSVHAECTPGRNPCAAKAQCRIVDGRFHCTCDPGTSGNGTTCKTFTSTPTPTWTATSTARVTHSLSPTPSSAPSITTTATHTVMPTSTAAWSACVESPGAAASGPLQFSGTSLCTQALSLGPGSVSLKRRSVYLLILEMLDGELSLRFESGCPATAPGCPVCDACTSRFTTQHVGRPQLLPAASSSEISVVLLYNPPITTGRTRGARAVPRAASGDIVAEIYAVSEASPLLLLLLCLLPAVCVACALGLCWWRGHCFAVLRIAKWNRNPRLQQRRVRAGLLVSAWAVGVGTIWVLVAMVTSDPEARPQALLYTGVAMTAVGSVVLLSIGAWACWDESTYVCHVCQLPVSRFRYAGVYLPTPDGQAVAGKAHVLHVSCMLCKQPVVWDPWPEAPAHRPWHMSCWQAHCDRVSGDAEFWEQWCAAQGAALTDIERVHMCAAAIEQGAGPAVLHALRREPRLHAFPVAAWDGGTVMHLAARAGSVAVLQLMSNAASLAPYFVVDPALGCSLSLQLAPDPDMADIYIHQPLLLYNGLPVYVGHTHGQYIYYYQPARGDTQPADAGWCLSVHLGSGKPKFRLLLDCVACGGSARDLPEGLPTNPPEELAPKPLSPTQSMKKLFTGRSKAFGSPPLMKKVDDCAISMDLQDPGPVADPPGVACAVPMLTPKDMGLAMVPHVRGLLDEAVASGDEATIRHVIWRHKDQYPQCLTWQYRAGDGLWQDYIPAVQSEISAALAQGHATLRAQAEGVACALDLRALTHETASGQIRTIRSRVWPAFVCGGALVSAVDAVGDWVAGCVVDFAHLPATVQDRRVLALLHEEGLVDFSLVAPPCKDRMLLGSPDELCRQFFEEALRTEFGQVMGHSRLGADIPCLAVKVFRDLHGTTRRRSSRADTTGIGCRLNDGLEALQVEDGQIQFYEPGYRSPVGVLPFCVSLAVCPLGLSFELEALVEMAMNALMKLHELQRQRCALLAEQALAIYVYTYQLRDIGEPQDQIYTAMNTAMRLGDARSIAFWRPLIWAIDAALEVLPDHRGKLYRGINLQFDCSVYKSGHKTAWRAFSSASKSRAVAQDFSTGTSGTLFFLNSVSAKSIAQYSEFPEEEEVLFQPNTVFSITSTLQGSSDIGQFYSQIDNVAMEECKRGHGTARRVSSEDMSTFQMLVQGPKVLEPEFMDFVETMAACTETITDRDLGVMKRVVLNEALATCILSPQEAVLFSPHRLPMLSLEPMTPWGGGRLQVSRSESPYSSGTLPAPVPVASPEPEVGLTPRIHIELHAEDAAPAPHFQ